MWAIWPVEERQAKMRAAPADKNTELVMTRNSNPSPNHNPVKRYRNTKNACRRDLIIDKKREKREIRART